MIRDYTGIPEKPDTPTKPGGPPRIVTCPDCGGAIPETIQPGRHSPHLLDGRRLVNCAGKDIEP